jgi:hypothetical protein
MYTYPIPKTTKKLLVSKVENWKRALNKLVSNTQIRPDELSDMIDCQLVEDGKIQCPRDGQAYFGNTTGSRVRGLFAYYKSDGTNELLRADGTTLKKFNTATSNWDAVSGYTYTNDLDTNGVMAYDKLFLENGTDPLTYYDGSSIQSFTAINPPNAPTVTRTGTTGSYTYSYKITAVTAAGETTGSTEGHSDLNVATLDSSSYMTVSWAAVTNAIGYNVYGRKNTSWTFMKYLEGNGSTTYLDKGSDTPYEATTPPEGNSTGGQKGNYIALYKDSLFIAGDTVNPSRLYYSGGGDKITDFTVGGGGGFIDVSKNDGQKITGMIVFKDALLIFKERSIYKFAFSTSGAPAVEQINPAIGCISPRSIVQVENDVFFASEFGVYTIGNEAGFSFDVLRTNELSARVRSIYQTISPTAIDKISAVYAKVANKNLVIFCYPESGNAYNNKAIIYDRERLGWYQWTNIQANSFLSYKDADGNNRVLYGDDNSGYVKEILTGNDDFGSQIEATFTLRSESFNGLNLYKRLKDLDLILRSPTGSITLTIIKDGIETVKTVNLTTVQPSINFGHYVLAKFLLGESYGTGAITSQDNNLLRSIKNLGLEGRSFSLKFENLGSGRFTLLLAGMTAKSRSERYRKSTDLVQ